MVRSDEEEPTPAEFGEGFVRDQFLPCGGADGVSCTESASRMNHYYDILTEDCDAFQIDVPRRVDPPGGRKIPLRTRSQTRDEQIGAHFGATAHHNHSTNQQWRRDGAESKEDAVSIPKARAYSTKPSKSTNFYLSKIKDYSMIEKASKRAGRERQEAYASYCKGILYDNIGQTEQALVCYKHFYSLCRKIGDVKGESIACNHCGVNCYYLAVGEDECAALTVGLGDGARKVDDSYIEEAIQFHEDHLELAEGEAKFSAQTNLGLCFSKVSNLERAAECHKDALQQGTVLSNPHLQSIALGNLAITMAKLGEYDTARTYMCEHLKLVTDLKNEPAICLAYQQLGELARESGDVQTALQYYGEARCIAQKQRAFGMLKLVNCKLGVIQGSLRFQEYETNLKF